MAVLARTGAAHEGGDRIMAYIQKRGNTYRIRVSNGTDQEGRRRYESTTWKPAPGMTERQEQKALAAFVLDFEQKVKTGKLIDGEKVTFAEFEKIWEKDHAEKKLEPTTLQGYQWQLRKYILPEIGTCKLSQVQPLQLQRFYNRLSESGADDGSGLSRASIKQVHAVISSIYQTAIRWGYAAENPCERVELPADPDQGEEERKCFTPEEAQTFLALLDKPMICPRKAHTRVSSSGKAYAVGEYTELQPIPTQIKLFLHLAMYTGARRGELLALTWEDVDTDKQLLTINKNLAVVNGKLTIKKPKSKTSNRTITLQPHLCSLLQEWKAEQMRQRLQVGLAWEGYSGKQYDKNHVFIQYNGIVMHPSTPYHAFKKIIKRYNENLPAGSKPLPEIPLHGLRHTSATIQLNQNIPVKAVSKRLGHSSASVTMNIYAHSFKSQDEAAADALASVLPPAGS